MRIVIDLQPCQSGSRYGGIGRYSFDLARAMISAGPQHEFILILNDLLDETILDLYASFADLLPRQQILTFQVPGSVAERDPANSPRARIAEILRERFIEEQLQPDILHVASLFEGLNDNVVSSVECLTPGSHTSVTLYDLIPWVAKDRYLNYPLVRNHYCRKLDMLGRAGSLLAISDYTKNEAVRELGIDPTIITNISAGVDPKFQPCEVPLDEADKVRKRFGIDRPFLLFTGSFDQRKNQGGLIEAFSRLPAELRDTHQLVFIGNGYLDIYEGLWRQAARFGLQRDQVVFAGRVGDHDLLSLYHLAKLFVFPSLAEGYGLPVLEAMACGLPAICSNITSIPEVRGRADALFDPRCPDSMAALMQRALCDVDFRRSLREHGLEYSQQFTWEASARAALGAFEEQLARQGAPRRDQDVLQDSCLRALRPLLDDKGLPGDFPVKVASALVANQGVLAPHRKSAPCIGWLTPWKGDCAAARFARRRLAGRGDDVLVLSPRGETGPSAGGPKVMDCWTRRDDLRSALDVIRARGLDTLVIQWHPDLYVEESFARLLRELLATGRHVYLYLHGSAEQRNQLRLDRGRLLNLCDAVLDLPEQLMSDGTEAVPKIGWVTTWHSRCGIAMYARHLAGDHLTDYQIFAPVDEQTELADGPEVVRCWWRNGKDLRSLADALHERDVKTLLIQFQYGFFDFPALAGFLREMLATGRSIHLIFHATADTPERRLADLAPLLGSCAGLYVHSPHDLAAFAAIGLQADVERLSHGVPVQTPAALVRPAPAERFLIASYGFFLPHKGLLELIEAVGTLIVERGHDLHLLMVNAAYPAEVSTELIASARQCLAELGLEDRTTLLTDFLSDAESLGYLRHADLIVYPYQQTGESSSAALRMGLVAGRPVAVTPLQIFDDLREQVLTLPGVKVSDITAGLEALIPRIRNSAGDPEVRDTLDRAVEWCASNSYPRLSAALWQRLSGHRSVPNS